jgi:hypothetical protein
MAKVYNIADSALFCPGSKAQKYKTASAASPKSWARVIRAVSSPTAIVGYFILLLMGCSRLH